MPCGVLKSCGRGRRVNPENVDMAKPEWYYTDNGFTSMQGLEAEHKPIVALARNELTGVCGNIVDLGCGNGVLASKLCAMSKGLIPWGYDINRSAVEHAAILFPRYRRQFVPMDIFEPAVWTSTRHYVLACLMIRRLEDVSGHKAFALLRNIAVHCDRLLLHLSRGWSHANIEMLAAKSGLRLRVSVGHSTGLVSADSLAELTRSIPSVAGVVPEHHARP
jgi:hypothetical protein